MIVKKVIGDELYVYMNGKCIYKRWLKQDHGIVFDKFGVFKPKFDKSYSIT